MRRRHAPAVVTAVCWGNLAGAGIQDDFGGGPGGTSCRNYCPPAPRPIGPPARRSGTASRSARPTSRCRCGLLLLLLPGAAAGVAWLARLRPRLLPPHPLCLHPFLPLCLLAQYCVHPHFSPLFPVLPPAPPSQVRDSLGRLVELPIDTHPGHYRRETATIHSSAIVRLASQLRSFPPGGRSAGRGGAGWLDAFCCRPVPAIWVRTNLHPVARRLPTESAHHAPACPPPRPPRPPGSALFLEVKHWKGDKKRFSTLAWSVCPLDRLVDFGAQAARVRARGCCRCCPLLAALGA